MQIFQMALGWGVTLLLTGQVWAWGPTGHRAVGEIAEKHLRPQALAAVNEILDGESLAIAAVWADEVRSHPDKAYYNRFLPWHYVTIPIGQTYETSPKNAGGDVYTATEEQIQILRSIDGPNSPSKDKQREALRLLVHFIGDLHQPLHAGNERDRGGNWCETIFFGERMNIHEVWDEGIIDSTQLSYTEYAKKVNRVSADKVAQWQRDSLLQWVTESNDLHHRIYPTQAGNIGAGPDERPYCKSSSQQVIPDAAVPKISYDYRFQVINILEERLLQGGVRLAGVLNSIFAQ
jgi:hypothetical protein